MNDIYAEFRDTPLWRTVAAALAELEANGEVSVSTAPDYVIGYLCQQLVVRNVVAPTALGYDP